MAPFSRLLRLSVAPALAALAVFGAAGGASAQDSGDDPALVDEGAVIYESSCAGCHGADGEGTGFGRSLIGVAEQQPDRTVHLASVANGIRNMPEFSSDLDDQQIDAVVSYVRLTFVAAQADDGEDAAEETRDELPRTGGTLTLAGIALALIGGGAGLELLARRRDVAPID